MMMTRTAARPACWCAEAQQRLRAVAAAPAKRNPTELKTNAERGRCAPSVSMAHRRVPLPNLHAP